MSRSNLTILEQNTVLGMEHDDTQELYLRGAQKDELRAFRMACEWQDSLRPFLQKFVPLGVAQHPHLIVGRESTVSDEVIDFIRERHFRRYFPNNTTGRP